MNCKTQTNSSAATTTANGNEREEYFLSERDLYLAAIDEKFVPEPIPEDPREWRLFLSVPLGELTHVDAEYIRKRAEKWNSRLIVHTAAEVDRYQLCEALQRFDRKQNETNIIDVVTVRFMKELVAEAATLRSLYPPQAASTPVNANESKTKRKTKGKTAWCVAQWQSAYSDSKTPWVNILDDWNKLPEEQRKAIDPRDYHTFPTGESGRGQVSKRCKRNS
ncbi:MAG: hypothetical protein ACRC46_01535 [Thermoguttaceae bacterium]